MNFLKIITVLVTLLIFDNMWSQQEAQYTQYMYNTASVNPAYAGSRETTSFTALHRQQWANIDGAPITQTINFDTPLKKLKNVGLGVSVIQDKIRPTTETNISVDLSYALQFKNESRLLFGTKLVANLLSVDLVNLSRETFNDVVYSSNIERSFSPNFGLGVYYSTHRFYAGLSVPNILETTFFDESTFSNGSTLGNSVLLGKKRINYYFISGYVFDLNNYTKFKPAIFSKAVYGAPLQVDISGNFLIRDKFLLGAAYRWSAAVSGLMGVKFFKSLFLGMAFDIETTPLRENFFQNSSYEFVLRYDILGKLNKFATKMKTPRFF